MTDRPNVTAPVAENTQNCSSCDCDQIDIKHNKGYAFICYFSLLWLVPLFFAKHSKFARYHCNQGILITLAGIALSIASGIIGGIFGFIGVLFGSNVAIIASLFTGLIGFLAGAAQIALMVFGLINVFKGRCKPVPIIGNIVIYK